MYEANRVALENELVEALCANDRSPLVPRAKLFFGFDYPGAQAGIKKNGQRCLRPGSDYLFRKTDETALANLLASSHKLRSEELASASSDEFGSIPNWRLIIAGLPGGGKTSTAATLHVRLIEEQIHRLSLDKVKPHWRLPLRLSAEDVLAKGLPSAIIEGLQETYSSNISYPLFRAAYRCGYYVLFIDDIGLWAQPGERLTVSNPLVSELLATAGETGQFVCTIDSRFRERYVNHIVGHQVKCGVAGLQIVRPEPSSTDLLISLDGYRVDYAS
jgi:hypothetical protein